MLSLESVADIGDDTPSFTFPKKYNFGDFLRSYQACNAYSDHKYHNLSKVISLHTQGAKITFPRPDELFNGTSLKLHEYSSPSIVGSNGSQHKFLASSKPSDRYVINVSDIGPQRKVEEFFTRVGVSFLCFGIAQDQTYDQTDFQKLSCFKNGLNMSAVRGRSMVSLNRLKKCPCLENYYGSQCSIPGCVYKVPKNSKITCQQMIITKKIAPCLFQRFFHLDCSPMPGVW